jgi:hypothetical protein
MSRLLEVENTDANNEIAASIARRAILRLLTRISTGRCPKEAKVLNTT